MNEKRKKFLVIGLLALLLLCGAGVIGFFMGESHRSGLASIRNLPNGAQVVAADKGSALDLAGLQESDLVVAVNGRRVTQDQTFPAMILSTQSGDIAAMEVQRGSLTMLISSPVDAGLLSFAANADLDAAMNAATLNASAQSGNSTLGGLSINANAQAGKNLSAGLNVNASAQSGDLITAVAGANVDANHSLASLLLRHKPGETINLTVRHSNGDTLAISAVLDSNLLNLAAKADLQSRLNKLTVEAGLRAGDKITAVSNIQIDAKHSLGDLLMTFKPGDTMGLTVQRDGKSVNLSIKVDSQLFNLAGKVGLQPGDQIININVNTNAKSGAGDSGKENIAKDNVDVSVKRGDNTVNISTLFDLIK